METTSRVREILSWYPSDNPGSLTNLYRLLMHGRLAGTGKLVILPVDQGFEHGPARSFAPNPPGYDPEYHVQLAIDAGCNAYAAPLGFIAAVAVAAYAAQIACQLGSHVVKVKPPGDFIYQPEAQKVFEKYNIPWKTLPDRVRHVVQSCFNGKRVVIFSGGEAKGTDEILSEIRGLRDGGALGSIMGRNPLQRPREEAIQLLRPGVGIDSAGQS